jgi:purine-nucleoside phosphorylase
MKRTVRDVGRSPPILASKDHRARSLFKPEALLREARRQKGLEAHDVPPVCVLDPDGDIVGWLRANGAARRSAGWACYHTELFEFELNGRMFGIVGRAVGSSFAVLIAEQLFASACQLLISISSAGQIVDLGPPPYFVVIDRALRDEGTSYHYLPPAEFAEADPALVSIAQRAALETNIPLRRGASWTTDAPFRETAAAIETARKRGILAVEMEAAALYAFAIARAKRVLCFAHVTNVIGRTNRNFEKGDAYGTTEALKIIAGTAEARFLESGQSNWGSGLQNLHRGFDSRRRLSSGFRDWPGTGRVPEGRGL